MGGWMDGRIDGCENCLVLCRCSSTTGKLIFWVHTTHGVNGIDDVDGMHGVT